MFQKEFKSFIQIFMSHYQSLCIFFQSNYVLLKSQLGRSGLGGRSQRGRGAQEAHTEIVLISEKCGSDNHLRQCS